MKLYRVRVEIEMVVQAEDPGHAERLALRHVDEETHNAQAYVNEVTTVADLPRLWARSLPYGDDPNDENCSEILAQSAKGNG